GEGTDRGEKTDQGEGTDRGEKTDQGEGTDRGEKTDQGEGTDRGDSSSSSGHDSSGGRESRGPSEEGGSGKQDGSSSGNRPDGPTGHVKTGVGGSVRPDTTQIAAGAGVLAATAVGGAWLLRRRASGTQGAG
ncbi:hypothetical protein ACIQCQ_25825, partial [Streptomyces sp. NPDC088394]